MYDGKFCNVDVRVAMLYAHLDNKGLAKLLGLSENWVSRKLQKEMPDEVQGEWCRIINAYEDEQYLKESKGLK